MSSTSLCRGLSRFAPVAALLCLLGCDLGLDPDSLVRDLRVLAVRTGDDAPASLTDIDLQMPRLKLSALVAEPTGAGRKVAAPRTLSVDWYLCLPGKTQLSTGSVDPTCVAFGPADPPAKDNPSLIYLASGAQATVDLANLQSVLLARLGPLLMGAGSSSSGGTTPPAIEIQLPVILRAQATPPTPDGRDAETGLAFVRLVLPLVAGQPLPQGAANRNPVLQPLRLAQDDQGTNEVALTPCQPQVPCQRTSIRRGQTLYFKASATPESVESYLPLDQSGRGVQPEVMRYSWFSSDGEFSELRTGDVKPLTNWQNGVTFAAPAAAQVMQLWLILQDGRNGTDSAAYEFSFSD